MVFSCTFLFRISPYECQYPFLNGNQEKEVYMLQPNGFVQKRDEIFNVKVEELNL